MSEPDEMSCREVVELVNDYLEGALAPHEVELFERHLSSCDGCHRYLAQMRLTIDAVGLLREEDVPVATLERLRAAFTDWKER